MREIAERRGAIVAAVREMADLIEDLPAWITPSPGSRGFAELAAALLEAR